MAVLEKGKQAGSHLLSGAVVNPRSLRRLFRDRRTVADMPFYGAVDERGRLLPDQGRRDAHPGAADDAEPPQLRRLGLASSGAGWPSEAEAGGAMILPETAAERLLVADGRVRGVRTGDKGRGRNGEPLPNFEPGSDITGRVTVLAEGTQGHLTGVAIERFGLQGDSPQVWALGVKEVWKVANPLDRVIHTMGWPLRGGKRFREFGGSFIYPMGDDMVTLGLVVGLDYRDAELSVHDVLQELKTHKLVRKILAGGERVQWGAKTIPEGGLLAVPKRLHASGLLLCGDGAGLVNVPALKGIHYAVESGRLAAEAAYAAVQPGMTPARSPGAVRRGAARELRVEGPLGGAQHAPRVRPRLLDGRCDGGCDDGLEGALPAEGREPRAGRRAEPHAHRARLELPRTRRQAHLRQALVGLRVGQPDA